MKTIETQLRELVSEQLGIDPQEVTAESSFMRDLGADSLDGLELAIAAEAAFQIAIDDRDVDRLATFGQLLAHVEQLIAQKRAQVSA